MSVRNLEVLFRPHSVALIGASKQPRSVGAVLAHNLFNAGFEGPVMPVNPHEVAIEGVLTYPSIEALPLVPDLAVVATPPPTVPEIVAALGARGTRAVVVITAGFSELGESGRALQQAMLDAARPHTLRIVGPKLPRRHGAGPRAERELCPGTGAPGRSRVRQPVRRGPDLGA